MSRHDSFLRFPTAAPPPDPAVERWISGRPAPLRPLVARWVLALRDLGPDVRELVHDDAATTCVGDAEFAYVAAFTNHVSVGFFNGAALSDPKALLEGTGKRGRHHKVRPGQRVDEAALLTLIAAAHEEAKARSGRG